MTPVLPGPILVPDVVLRVSANVFSVIVVSFTTFLYLAMALFPFWKDSGSTPPDPESPDDPFDQGEKK
jgi:hypothetical protein